MQLGIQHRTTEDHSLQSALSKEHLLDPAVVVLQGDRPSNLSVQTLLTLLLRQTSFGLAEVSVSHPAHPIHVTICPEGVAILTCAWALQVALRLLQYTALSRSSFTAYCMCPCMHTCSQKAEHLRKRLSLLPVCCVYMQAKHKVAPDEGTAG